MANVPVGGSLMAVPGQPIERVKSADRTLLLLEHLSTTSKRQTLSQLHQALGIPKSSLHALLHTLVDRGWVEVDESKTLFQLGVKSLLVGTAFIDTDATVMQGRRALDALAELTRETVHHGRLDGADMVYLATRQSTHDLRLISKIGHRLPAHATALGKAILAQNLDRFEELYPSDADLSRLTAYTISDRAALQRELEATLVRGYAVDREENTIGVNCFAMPLTTGATVRDAISLSVPLARLDPNRERELIGLLEKCTAVLGLPQPHGATVLPA
jgi:DNA-binding IclR family transcriptional regulator